MQFSVYATNQVPGAERTDRFSGADEILPHPCPLQSWHSRRFFEQDD